jgi:Zn-dependent metalloprotease
VNYLSETNRREPYTGTEDNGGVHINSGIPNFAFYKFATETGKPKAEKVYYRALTNYLTAKSQRTLPGRKPPRKPVP